MLSLVAIYRDDESKWHGGTDEIQCIFLIFLWAHLDLCYVLTCMLSKIKINFNEELLILFECHSLRQPWWFRILCVTIKPVTHSKKLNHVLKNDLVISDLKLPLHHNVLRSCLYHFILSISHSPSFCIRFNKQLLLFQVIHFEFFSIQTFVCRISFWTFAWIRSYTSHRNNSDGESERGKASTFYSLPTDKHNSGSENMVKSSAFTSIEHLKFIKRKIPNETERAHSIIIQIIIIINNIVTIIVIFELKFHMPEQILCLCRLQCEVYLPTLHLSH